LLKPVVDFPLENLILAESTQFRSSQLTRSAKTLANIMKKNIFLISIMLFGILSCKNEVSEKKTPSKANTPKIVEKNSNPIFSRNDFSLVYQYLNGESNQLIGINITDKKTIKFHLVTETLPCDTEYWGIAKDKYSDIASEVDNDENGTAYGAKEYVMNEPEYTIAIRLALDSSKVQIKYVLKNGKETDCLPITEELMKRIK
jgi:hypothetical protein